MYALRDRTILLLLPTFLSLAVSSAFAADPNNTPGTATILPGGQLVVLDSLDGSAGRPDTILGLFDPSGTTLLDSDDNGSSLGNNFASQLLDVPIFSDGSIFFKVTGSPDSTFVGNHVQNGKYAWFLDVRDPNGQIVPGLSQSFANEEISPFNQDSIWLLPSASPDPLNPNWVGFTVDMTINNIVGPGTGDSLDFFTFTGLEPFQEFTATLDANFPALIALYDRWNAASSDEERAAIWREMLDIHADAQFTIGTVSGVMQPVIVSNALRNVPEQGVFGWDPGAQLGIYRIDAFWLDR